MKRGYLDQIGFKLAKSKKRQATFKHILKGAKACVLLPPLCIKRCFPDKRPLSVYSIQMSNVSIVLSEQGLPPSSNSMVVDLLQTVRPPTQMTINHILSPPLFWEHTANLASGMGYGSRVEPLYPLGHDFRPDSGQSGVRYESSHRGLPFIHNLQVCWPSLEDKSFQLEMTM